MLFCLNSLLQANVLWANEPLLSNVRQLTFEGQRSGEGYFSADGRRIVFQSERDAENPFYQIYLMDLETGDVECLSPGVGKTTCAWIHPSNQKVLYASTHEDPEAHRKMQAELEFRASGQQRRYSWDYDPSFDIYVHDLASGERRNLTATLGYDAEGAYSPDGSKIVFASNRLAYAAPMSPEDAKRFEHDKSFMMDLYLMDADGSNVRRLTRAPGYDGGPFFSADGKRITWRRFSLDGATAEIFTMDLASGEERRLTHMGVMSWAPYFHPSGEYLIFATNRQGFANFELYLVDAAGKQDPVRVTYTDGFDGLPVFSPDGAKLSWTSKRGTGGKSQIFLADWDHAGARRLCGLTASAETPKAAVEVVDLGATEVVISAADARSHVQRLASAEMEGRLTGTEGERRATAYVAAVFEQLGLQPGGDEGGWYQAFPFTAGVELGERNRLAIEGLSVSDSPELNRDWRPLALSRDGEVQPAGVVFAGYGIVAPGLDQIPDYDSYGELDVKGKWVMVLRFQPESVKPAWRSHLVHYSDLPYKASVAKRLGALGLIVVTGPEAQARDRLVELKSDTSSGTSIAGLALSDEVAAKLLATTGKDLQQLQQELDKGETVEGFVIPDVMISANVDISRVKKQGRNVIGILKAEPPSELAPVIMGAHVDHLGQGEVSGSLAKGSEHGQIHFGADDNASGVAAMLESAQYLVGLQEKGKLGAKRDLWFIAWSGEELGTLGSSHFTEQLAGKGDLKDRVSAYLNMDMVGHLRDKVYLQGTGSSSLWPREIERRNVPVGLAIATKSDPYLPTDATPFYMKGVPVLNAFTGAHEDYSTPRDLPDQLNYEGIRDIARLMAGITRSLTRSENEPDYIEVARQSSGLSRKHLRAYLGTIPAYGEDVAVKGVKLQGAVKGGPAEQAGVQEGDVIVGLAGIEVENIHDFMGALAGLKVGEQTTMTVLRDGQRVDLEVVPGSRE
jgi:Tol biopolymer transport system component